MAINPPHPPPGSPLLNVNVFICAKVRIWINLIEKYGTKFGFCLLMYYKKNVDFKVDDN